MFIYPLLSFSLSTFTDRLVGQSPGPDVKQVEFWNMRHIFFCLCPFVCLCLSLPVSVSLWVREIVFVLGSFIVSFSMPVSFLCHLTLNVSVSVSVLRLCLWAYLFLVMYLCVCRFMIESKFVWTQRQRPSVFIQFPRPTCFPSELENLSYLYLCERRFKAVMIARSSAWTQQTFPAWRSDGTLTRKSKQTKNQE